MKANLLWCFLLIIPLNFAQAKSLTLVTERGQILIPSLPDWELGENMFGMPFIYFSPRANEQRSNISFTSTGVEADIDLPSLGKNQDTYKKIKTEWVQTIDGKADGFIPYKRWNSKQGHTVHQIGFEFTHESKSYLESSYYIECRGSLVFSKSLRLKINLEHQAQFEKLIDAVDCGL